MSVSTISATQNANGRLQLFAAGLCSGTVFTTQQSANGWQPWSSIASPGIVKQFAAGHDQDGRIDGFALTAGGKCYRFLQSAVNGSSFQWNDIGANGWQQIELAPNADGRLELFALVAGEVFHLWQTSPNGAWSGSESMGAKGIDQIAVGRNADGRLEVFALAGGRVFHFWQTLPLTPPHNSWSSSELFPTQGLEQIAVGRNADGRLEVFALAGGRVFHFWQTLPLTPPHNSWSSSELFPTQGLERIAVANNADGRLEVFALTGGNVWHFWQTLPLTPPHNGWSNAESFGTNAVSDIAIARNSDGRLEAFVVAGDNVSHFWQVSPLTPPHNSWSGSANFPAIEAKPSVTLVAAPTTILEGQSTTLTWTSQNASKLFLDKTAVPPSGSTVMAPSSSTDYGIVASSNSGLCTAAASAHVTVQSQPPQTVTRQLQLDERDRPAGPGQSSQWMFYDAQYPVDPALKGKVIQRVNNPNPFALTLTHITTSTSITLAAHTDTTAFNGEELTGVWQAEILNVDELSAPLSLSVDVTLG
jgi:hypothetical protein